MPSALGMTRTDEELVARSIRGDADSFNELILRWERPIYALAYRTIGRLWLGPMPTRELS